VSEHVTEERFTLDGRTYNYFPCRKNERCVEIALGLEFVASIEGRRFMEVGNVMRAHNSKYPRNLRLNHFVLDKDEQRKDWLNYKNADVLKWEPNGRLHGLLSISTLEHTGQLREALDRVFSWSVNALVTFPLGYPSDDQTTPVALADWPGIKVSFMMRGHAGPDNWRQVSAQEIQGLAPEEYKWGGKYEATATAIAILRKTG
jgi:hypothetical protein